MTNSARTCKYPREFIPYRCAQLIGDSDRPGRAARTVGRDLHIHLSTMHRWVQRAIHRAATAAATHAPTTARPNELDVVRRRIPHASRHVANRRAPVRLTDLVRDYERLATGNATREAALVLNPCDLDRA